MLRPSDAVQSNCVAVPALTTGPLFSNVLPSFLDYMSAYEEWRVQTLAQNKTTYAMFMQCCGDLPVTAYERNCSVARFVTRRDCCSNQGRRSRTSQHDHRQTAFCCTRSLLRPPEAARGISRREPCVWL